MLHSPCEPGALDISKDEEMSIVYVGNWNLHGDAGISICRFDEEKGTLHLMKTIRPDISVGTLACSSDKRVIYCADENPHGGRVLSFAMDKHTGNLKAFSVVSTGISGTAFLTADRSDRSLIAVNYANSGDASELSATDLYRIDTEGSITGPEDRFLHARGADPAQGQAHAHSAAFSPDESFFTVCDTGADRIYAFSVNEQTRVLQPCMNSPVQCEHGMGPRYQVYHPYLPYLIVNNEKKTYLSSFRYDVSGMLIKLQDAPLLDGDKQTTEHPGQSGLAMSADGRYVYTLLREKDVVVTFRVEENGTLTRLQVLEYGGKIPKGCTLSPDGRFLLIASRGTSDVITLAVQPDGTLERTGISARFPCPAVITFC